MTEQKEKERAVFCPYCDDELLGADLPYCQACGLKVFNCPKCQKPVPRDNKVCPYCEAEIKG